MGPRNEPSSLHSSLSGERPSAKGISGFKGARVFASLFARCYKPKAMKRGPWGVGVGVGVGGKACEKWVLFSSCPNNRHRLVLREI